MKNFLIVSINSDIARYFAECWSHSNDNRVLGTTTLAKSFIPGVSPDDVIQFDISQSAQINKLTSWLDKKKVLINNLIFATGTQIPVGRFFQVEFEEWEKSINVNTVGQLRILHAVKKFLAKEANVIFFAGGGSNNAPINYSAYTSSKIHLTKMVELLDAEEPDYCFSIIGPGWVKTKIHNPTLISGPEFAGENFFKTQKKLAENNEFTPYQKIFATFNWVINSRREIVSGRNFSVVFDAWGTKKLENQLRKDKNMYKLRRSGNDWSEEKT